MKITKTIHDLLSEFNANWVKSTHVPSLSLSENEISDLDSHPLQCEINNLIQERGGTLPFFTDSEVVWCAVAPSYSRLKKYVRDLQAWIIPSYGWQNNDDGYLLPDSSKKGLQKTIATYSPENYFRWRSSTANYSVIQSKLELRYQLEQKRPARVREQKSSRFELRARFETALLTGDRSLADQIIVEINNRSLDTSTNTKMMSIRLWHHFREFESIRTYKDLADLREDPSLPRAITDCIREALGEEDPEPPTETAATSVEETETTEVESQTADSAEIEVSDGTVLNDWDTWFNFLAPESDERNRELASAQDWLREKTPVDPKDVNPEQIKSYADNWNAVFLNDQLLREDKPLICKGLSQFLEDFVREPDFPRSEFTDFYSALLRLWYELYKGTGGRREEGHVLLELARALLVLNHEIKETKETVEAWWKARPVPAQLPFALDAIELLHDQHPDEQAVADLWFEASALAKRNSLSLLKSEKKLWREVGLRIGLEEKDVEEYFPVEVEEEVKDLLESANLKKVAIVCMWEKQAKEAAKTIEKRIDAKVSIVSSKVAGANTKQALTCDVVLFVWMATSHAVFRGFDDYDKERLCYVQGTGAGSIVRTLERWVMEQQEEVPI